MRRLFVLFVGLIGGCAGMPSVPPPHIPLATITARESATFAPKTPPRSMKETLIQEARREFRKSGKAPIKVRRNFVLQPIGLEEARAYCSILRACVIELLPGERIQDFFIGDSVRWLADAASTASSDYIVVKPTDHPLVTNVVVWTDKTVYHVLLTTRPDDYVRRLVFYDQAGPLDAPHYTQRVTPSAVSQYDYTITGNQIWRPNRVWDNGQHLFIAMPFTIFADDAPLLFEKTPEGRLRMVRYRVRGNLYITDTLLDQAVLTIGRGSNAEQVTITRQSRATY